MKEGASGWDVAVLGRSGGGGPGKNSGPFWPQPVRQPANKKLKTMLARPFDLLGKARRPKIWLLI
jgi:hypothetical protein